MSPTDPDARAAELVAAMTLDEKIQLVTGFLGMPVQEGAEVGGEGLFGLTDEMTPPPGAVGSDGFVPGIPRLGIPALQLAGAGVGVTSLVPREGGESVSFPSSMSQTSTWNPPLIREFGRRIGHEARAQGINVMLGAACNLTIEPRSGRVFEYHGEDPILSGTITREELLGTQDEGVVASVKHYAANFQETGRFVVNSVVSERALREGELLAFEVALADDGEVPAPGAVMTSYNKLNGVYASENPYLLSQVLKGDWGFRGWVMSDWGAAHSTVESALAGLDQEFPHAHWYGAALKAAVESGEVPHERLDDMNHRILRTLAIVGVLDDTRPAPAKETAAGLETAQRIAEEGTVLLQNDGVLPIAPGFAGSIAVIGSHADVAVPSGGGSAAVRPVGGNPVPAEEGADLPQYWLPSSPLEALRAALPQAEVRFDGGGEAVAAADLAARSDLAIVVASQLTMEHFDVPDLHLPDGQDALVSAVAATGTPTIVVLETGGVVLTPWSSEVSAVLAAWYPGHRGGEALAAILTGAVNPSGKTPATFPVSEADLPHPEVFPMPPLPGREGPAQLTLVNILTEQQGAYFDAEYDEELLLGYKWFEAHGTDVAFPFGHGLSYTTFEYGDATAVPRPDGGLAVTVPVSNRGERRGREIVQVYAELPAEAAAPRRLVGWAKLELEPGETGEAVIGIPAKHLSTWSVEAQRWVLASGTARLDVAASSRDVRVRLEAELGA
ncbi:glycoside hydrolase family 3 protein [Homoserinibacter sp. YIM 151385]|uniref:glycoside hydrolase family 3 protein n=1 Tax=Homoserinibacter sp. YIM 151385 TaxID=2985506 RepID=UPI0022F11935|nr:glycoside hydrolase family 3 protein [Homoserinibacter sp. YIM 151385]WBU37510.1 glycoside hydrolase family 3 C-terminal domain-containing protein [Homoserinibacter sp. YIM 151385]